MKQTKIICSIGPASSSEEAIKRLLKAGMNFARLNFSHGDHAEHLAKINTIRKASKYLPLILDTKGPELRTGTLENGEALLVEGKHIILTTDEIIGNGKKVSINYKNLPNIVTKNDVILIEDGKMELQVTKVENNEITCKIIIGGVLENRKNVCIPNKDIDIPALTKKDIDDILFGIDQKIDIIAASFIRCKEDVLQIKNILKKNNSNMRVISKIEHKMAIDNIDEIIEASDGIMIARGDLGVQVDQEKVPFLQKMIIKKCQDKGKFCIVATQMLDSMITNPRPTRAEVTDVANAILDGADAIMLSGETAKGRFPIKTVETMATIADYAESFLLPKKREEVANCFCNKELPKRAVIV